MIKTDQMKAKDRTEAESVVNEDRKHAIEAAIVRTMKMRKVMMHNQLVLEVINQLVSRPSPLLPFARACPLWWCADTGRRRRTRCSSPTRA